MLRLWLIRFGGTAKQSGEPKYARSGQSPSCHLYFVIGQFQAIFSFNLCLADQDPWKTQPARAPPVWARTRRDSQYIFKILIF